MLKAHITYDDKKGLTEWHRCTHTQFGAPVRIRVKNICARVGIVPMIAVQKDTFTIDVVEYAGTHSEMHFVSQLNMYCLKIIEARLYG